MQGELILIVLIVIGIIGRSNILATAASLLLIMKLIHLERFFPAVERRGLEFGLLLLMMAVLVPFAAEKISWKEMLSMFMTPVGVLALVGGALATYLNGKGLSLLQAEPQLVMGLVFGSIFGILFLKGIPVGPLMAAGITVALLNLFSFLSYFFRG